MILDRDTEPFDHMVGVDPGETTGFCALRLGPVVNGGRGVRSRIIHGDVFMGQVNQDSIRSGNHAMPWYIQEARLQRNMAGRLEWLALSWGVDCLHLAIEDFSLRERTKDRSLLSPIRMTAGLLALLEASDSLNVVVHLNSASDGKGTVTDVVLRRLELYRPGLPHACDAARQAVLALRKEMG